MFSFSKPLEFLARSESAFPQIKAREKGQAFYAAGLRSAAEAQGTEYIRFGGSGVGSF